MKKSFFTAACFSICLFLVSCSDGHISQDKVPASVVTGFTTKYPGATDVKWKTEKHDGKMVYEAEFKMNDKKTEAEFDENGAFLLEEE